MKNQSGFTLIELVVVFVILGILAATAIPRFTTVTNQSRAAVADGIVGSIQSAAVISYATNSGAPSTPVEIMDEVACDADAVVTVEIAGGGAQTFPCDGNFDRATTNALTFGTCSGAPASVVVNVDNVPNTDTGAFIPAGLCSG